MVLFIDAFYYGYYVPDRLYEGGGGWSEESKPVSFYIQVK